MRRLQAGRHLQAEIQGLRARQGAPPVERLRQQFAREALGHRVDQPIVSLAQLMDRGDIRMLDLDRVPEALPQQGECDRIGGSGAQEQDGDLDPGRVFGTVVRSDGVSSTGSPGSRIPPRSVRPTRVGSRQGLAAGSCSAPQWRQEVGVNAYPPMETLVVGSVVREVVGCFEASN